MAMGCRLNQLTLVVVVYPNQDPQIPAAGTVTFAVVPAAVAAKVAVDFTWLCVVKFLVMIIVDCNLRIMTLIEIMFSNICIKGEKKIREKKGTGST